MKAKRDTNANILVWLTVQSLVIILASFLSFVFVIFSSRYLYGSEGPATLGYAFGTILPLCALLGALNYFLSKNTMKYVTILTDAIKRVSQGDFDVRLDEKQSVLSEVHKDFNKMCAELREVQMLRSDFINSYSHEFKTPITSINGFARLLLEQETTEEERRQYLQIIADESARLADLANSTILLSKLDCQEIVVNKTIYSLDEQLRECAILLSQEWSDKGISFTGDLAEVQYNGNAEMMKQLWLNLLSNAIKFTPPQGEIVVTLRKEGNNAVVQVADTGPGMSEEVAAHIFERYYQGDKSHKKQGLGLGLSIAKRIVDLCGGWITVNSTVNEGSIFTVILPLE